MISRRLNLTADGKLTPDPKGLLILINDLRNTTPVYQVRHTADMEWSTVSFATYHTLKAAKISDGHKKELLEFRTLYPMNVED